MRYALLFLSSLLSLNTLQASATDGANAVKISQVAGLYQLKSTDPVDPANELILMEDQVYAMATFIGIFSGTWSMADDVVTLSASPRKHHYLYGRYTEGLDTPALFNFRGNDLRMATFNFNSLDESNRKSIFNLGANCFSQTTSYMFNNLVNELELGYPYKYDQYDHHYDGDGFHLYNYVNSQGYNDFQLFVSDVSINAKSISKLRVVENGLQDINENLSGEPELIARKKNISDVSDEQLRAIRQQIQAREFPKELKYDHNYFPYLTREQEQDPKEIASYYLIEEVSIKHDKVAERPKTSLLTSHCD